MIEPTINCSKFVAMIQYVVASFEILTFFQGSHTIQSDILVAVDLGQVTGFDNIHLMRVYPSHRLRRL